MSNVADSEVQLNQISDHSYTLRFLATILLGFVVAGGLTMFMHVLIESSHKELDESARIAMLDFVRVKREESSSRKQVKPSKPQIDRAPPAPPTPQNNDSAAADTSLSVSMPQVSNINVDIGAIGIGASDGDYLPMVKIAPAYPARATMEGIEGDCMVEYTVTVTGATRDVRKVEGECPNIFARASIVAAKKFKYKPRVVGGEAIEVPNVKNRFKFRLYKKEEQ